MFLSSFFYVHSTFSSNIGIYMDSKSYNNCDFNSQELTFHGLNKNPQAGVVSVDSSMEPTRPLFLNSARGTYIVSLTSPALILTAIIAQNNFLE